MNKNFVIFRKNIQPSYYENTYMDSSNYFQAYNVNEAKKFTLKQAVKEVQSLNKESRVGGYHSSYGYHAI